MGEPEVLDELTDEDAGIPVLEFSAPASVTTIPFHGSEIQPVEVDGKPYVVFRPVAGASGPGYGS